MKKEKIQYLNQTGDSNINRYRDCDNLQYIFRGIDNYASWVNKIFFVTWGHIPKWLNTENKNIEIVKHTDFIPKEYLPTFNSNVIELNLHRIKNLSEKFILFNDDTFIMKKLIPEDFFINGKVVDVCVEYPQISTEYNDTYHLMNANINSIINKHFNKKQFIKNNLHKIINLKYGKYNLNTLYSMRYKEGFLGFLSFHTPQPYLKETFKVVWDKEYINLDNACKNKFRHTSDLGHILCRNWQFVTGNFIPKKKESRYLKYLDDNAYNIKELKSNKYKFICINDVYENIDFEKSKTEINNVLQELFPEKSQYEL